MVQRGALIKEQHGLSHVRTPLIIYVISYDNNNDNNIINNNAFYLKAPFKALKDTHKHNKNRRQVIAMRMKDKLCLRITYDKLCFLYYFQTVMIQCSYEYNTLLLLFSIREQAKKNTQLFSLLVFIMKLISTSGEHKHVFWFSLCRQVSAKEAAEALRSLQLLSL